MAHSAKDGVKLARLDSAVLSHVTVLVRLHVTHQPDGASVPQEGQDRDVKKTAAGIVSALTALCCASVPTGPAVMGSVGGACAHSRGWAPPVVKQCYTKPQDR